MDSNNKTENIFPLDLYPFLEKHPNIVEWCLRLDKMETLLNNDSMRYLFLVSMISSDTIIDEERANKSLETLTFINDNLKWMKLDEKILRETKKYVNKGLKIVKRDLKDFKKINKENTENGISD